MMLKLACVRACGDVTRSLPQEAVVVLARHMQHKLVRVFDCRLRDAGSCGVIDECV